MPLRVQRGSTKRTRRAALARKTKANSTRFINRYRGNTPPEFPHAEPKSNWEYSTPANRRTINRMLARHHATKSRRPYKPTHNLPSEFKSVLYSEEAEDSKSKSKSKSPVYRRYRVDSPVPFPPYNG